MGQEPMEKGILAGVHNTFFIRTKDVFMAYEEKKTGIRFLCVYNAFSLRHKNAMEK